jgi:hypothetical protein
MGLGGDHDSGIPAPQSAAQRAAQFIEEGSVIAIELYGVVVAAIPHANRKFRGAFGKHKALPRLAVYATAA